MPRFRQRRPRPTRPGPTLPRPRLPRPRPPPRRPSPTRRAQSPPPNRPCWTPRERGVLRNFLGYEFPPSPDTRTGPIDQAAVDILEVIWAGLELGGFDGGLVAALGNTGDARLAWIMSDLLRFFYFGDIHDGAVSGFERLTGARLNDDPVAERSSWQSVTDHLIAWDLPAFDGYADYKHRLFLLVEPRWEPLFADPDSTIDWRLVSWGGVRIDDRAFGDQRVCAQGCIPALDDPAVTDAAGGSWYADDGLVFAVVINGEARAYPRHIMEIHEMVNDTLGGRRIGMPYCTLCGSAQAYFTDDVPAGVETPVLRTSGLLARSNKVMYDLVTKSVFDTFTGGGGLRAAARAGGGPQPGHRGDHHLGRVEGGPTPTPPSSPRTAGSAAATRSTRCGAATTTAPSSRSATWTTPSASTTRSSAWCWTTAPLWPSPSPPPPRPPSEPARTSSSPG